MHNYISSLDLIYETKFGDNRSQHLVTFPNQTGLPFCN